MIPAEIDKRSRADTIKLWSLNETKRLVSVVAKWLSRHKRVHVRPPARCSKSSTGFSNECSQGRKNGPNFGKALARSKRTTKTKAWITTPHNSCYSRRFAQVTLGNERTVKMARDLNASALICRGVHETGAVWPFQHTREICCCWIRGTRLCAQHYKIWIGFHLVEMQKLRLKTHGTSTASDNYEPQPIAYVVLEVTRSREAQISNKFWLAAVFKWRTAWFDIYGESVFPKYDLICPPTCRPHRKNGKRFSQKVFTFRLKMNHFVTEQRASTKCRQMAARTMVSEATPGTKHLYDSDEYNQKTGDHHWKHSGVVRERWSCKEEAALRGSGNTPGCSWLSSPVRPWSQVQLLFVDDGEVCLSRC